MLQFFNAILYTPLFNFLVLLVAIIPGHQVGWAIVILTLLIRVALLPVTIHTARVQVRMRLLQPKIDALRKEHKNDKTLQSQALMNLYKEEKVSPFSSCLPLIVQVVVLVVLYHVFRNGLDTSHFDALYSFTPRPDHINTHFFGINLATKDAYVLPIVAGLTQLWVARVTYVPTSNPDDAMAMVSKQMVYLAPVMTFVFARSFPAGLPLYWAITNLFSVVQQEYVLKRQGLTLKNAAPAASKEALTPSHTTPEQTERKKGGVQVTVRKKS